MRFLARFVACASFFSHFWVVSIIFFLFFCGPLCAKEAVLVMLSVLVGDSFTSSCIRTHPTDPFRDAGVQDDRKEEKVYQRDFIHLRFDDCLARAFAFLGGG